MDDNEILNLKLSEEDVKRILINMDSLILNLVEEIGELQKSKTVKVVVSKQLAVTSDERVSLTIDVTEIECDGTTKLGVKLRGYTPVDWNYCSETVMVNDLSVLKGAVVGLVAKLILK